MPAVEVPPAQPPAEEGQAALLRALSARDGDLSCAQMEALVPEPVPALLQVVETVKMPPAAPMRAAGCLLENHGAEIEEQVIAWMQRPDTLGLALLVTDRLDGLSPELARRAAEAALAGPHAERLRERLAASRHPEVRALLGP